MTDPTPARPRTTLRQWFGGRPRAHGEPDLQRSVGYLELFYDLVFVAFIAQVGSRFAADLTWTGLGEFAVLFSMVWIAWMNGSLYHEAHGRDDGRHRGYIFAQMYLLIVLAALTPDATGGGSTAFALTYAALMALFTYQWWGVYRIDTVARFRRQAGQYTALLGAAALIVLASAWVHGPAQLALWALSPLLALGGLATKLVRAEGDVEGPAIAATASLAERFALLTIIVLGEVVVGVVNGIREAGTTPIAVTVGLLGLTVGFGFWWNYFDALGERTPRDSARSLVQWLLLHVPLHGAVAAAGVGMVALIGHAEEPAVALETRWLLAGTTAVLLLLVTALVRTVQFPPDAAEVLLPFQATMTGGAAVCVVIGLLPLPAAPFGLALVAVLAGTWVSAFVVRTHCELHKGATKQS